MRAQVDTLQIKTKASNQSQKKKPYANRIHEYEMMINDNKEDLKRKSCHLSQIN
jgi:hypothetical protein